MLSRALRRPNPIKPFFATVQITPQGLVRTARYQPNYHNASPQRFTPMGVIKGMIGVNIGVFCLWQYAAPPQMSLLPTQDGPLFRFLARYFMASPEYFRRGRDSIHGAVTLLTANFMHTEPFHIAFNMITAYTFGTILSMHRGLRAGKMLALCLGSGIAGMCTYVFQKNLQERNSTRRATSVVYGFSAVVSGLGAAACCFVPRMEVLLMGVIPVPLWVLVPGFVLWDSVWLNHDVSAGKQNVAYAGHLGGVAFGLAFWFLRMRTLPRF